MWMHKTVSVVDGRHKYVYESEVEIDEGLYIVMDGSQKTIAIRHGLLNVCLEDYNECKIGTAVSVTLSYDQGRALTTCHSDDGEGTTILPDQTANVKAVMFDNGDMALIINDVTECSGWVNSIHICPGEYALGGLYEDND